MKINNGADAVILVSMWVTFAAYVIGSVLAYTLRYCIDVTKLADPVSARKAIRTIGFPPASVLTDRGKRLRKVVVTLWLSGGISFLVVVFWALTRPVPS